VERGFPIDENATRRDWFGLDGFRPGRRIARGGGSCYLLESVGSTNDFLQGRGGAATGRLCTWDGWGWRAEELCELAPPTKAPVGTLVAARRQTAGRGRRGRTWHDCGGLHVSMIVPQRRLDFEGGLSVWLGLMVVLALREDLGVPALLKWPNDVIVNGRKLGGLIVERSGGDDPRTVAGLGLNLSAGPGEFPAALQGSATSLRLETGRTERPGDLLGRILQRIDTQLDRFNEAGWEPFREQIAACDHLAGRWITLAVASGRVTGKAVGIDERGALIVAVGERECRYHAGDVHIVATPGEGSVRGML
jgi:BirA family biotin operon repressor/biotin-[acetyl-CoA-carboxylase] ligase